jgi:hypothetical protein
MKEKKKYIYFFDNNMWPQFVNKYAFNGDPALSQIHPQLKR